MRLNHRELHAVKSAVEKNFGKTARVFLFGSRTDDAKWRGDIDLFIEHDPNIQGTELITKKLRTMSDIQFAIGDQKIDIVTAPFAGEDSKKTAEETPSIVRNAKKKKIPL